MCTSRNILKSFVYFLWMEQIVLAQVSCPSGDTAGIIKDGKTCSQLITGDSDRIECYDSTTETSCCASCNSVNTGIPSCPYGDQATCFDILCPSYVGDALSNCCLTCYVSTTTTTTTTTTPPPPTTTTTSSVTSPASSTSSASTASLMTSSTLSNTVTTSNNSTGSTGASTSQSSGSSAGLIAGAVIGSITSTIMVIAGVCYFNKYYNNKKNRVNSDDLEKDKSKMADTENRPDNVNKEFPSKAYNGHLGGLNTSVPPIATNNQIFQTDNNNTTKASLTEETSTEASSEKSELKHTDDKMGNNVKDNKMDIDSSNVEQNPVSPRQNLPPLQGYKPVVTNQSSLLPPIAYRK